MNRTKELEDLNESMGQQLYKASPAECKAMGICIDCKEPAIPNCYSDAGRKEFYISGLCERCFDSLFRV